MGSVRGLFRPRDEIAFSHRNVDGRRALATDKDEEFSVGLAEGLASVENKDHVLLVGGVGGG